MQLNRYLTVALAAAAAGSSSFGAAPETRSVTLDDCVQEALQHNLSLQIERVNPRIAQMSLSGTYAAYDPNFTMSAGRADNTQPGGIDEQGRPYAGTEQTTDSVSMGLSGLLPSGLNYRIGGSASDTFGARPGFIQDFTNPILGTSTVNVLSPPELAGPLTWQTVSYPTKVVRDNFENATARASIDLSQPLLKNFWIDSTRLNIQLRKKDLRYSELQLQYQMMQVVVAVQEAYYGLVATREQVKVSQKALQLSEQLLRENKKRVEVGVLAPLDEKQAESEVAANQAALLAAQNSYNITQNQLKNLISDKYAESEAMGLEPIENLKVIAQIFDRSESWQKGLTMRPDLQQSKVDLERRNIRLRYAKNQLYPQLDLQGSYGQLGSSTEYSGAISGVAEGDSPFYSFGAVMSIPLSNRAARTNYRSTKEDIQQALLRLKQSEQQIMMQIDNAIASAKSSLEQVDATRKAREYAEAALDAEQKKLDNGKSTGFQVLQFQRDVTSRRYQEISALTQYNIALARLALNEGTTLEKNNITVQVK